VGDVTRAITPLFDKNIVYPASIQHDENMSLNTNTFETRARASTKEFNNGAIRSRRSSQGTAERRTNVALTIRSLEQDEHKMKTVIVTAGVITAHLVWWIVRHLQFLQQAREYQHQKYLFATLSHISRKISALSTGVAVPPLPLDPGPTVAIPGSWAVVYMCTSLVFALSAIFVAMVVKKAIRDYRVVLQRRGRPLEKARPQESLDHGDVVAWFIPVAMDTTYRLYQVSLLALLLGIVNLFRPFGATIQVLVGVPSVICGLLYVFGSSDRP